MKLAPMPESSSTLFAGASFLMEQARVVDLIELIQASKKQLEDLQQPNDDPLLAESSSESTLVTPSRRCDSELDETPEKVDQMAGAQGQGEAGPDDETIPATDVEDLLQKLDTVATLPETNESSESAWPSDWHDAQSRRSPTLSPLREDDPYVIAFSDSGEEEPDTDEGLAKKLAAAMSSAPTSSEQAPGKETVETVASSPATPAGSHTPPGERPAHPSHESDTQGDESGDDEVIKLKAAMNAKLRRICQPKASSGQLDVSAEVHKAWKQKGKSREHLLNMLMECGGSKDAFLKMVTRRFKKSRKGSLKARGGFYSELQMKNTLGYPPKRIAAITKYCSHKSRRKTHTRKDKYEEDLQYYWVEFTEEGEVEKCEEEEETEEQHEMAKGKVKGLGMSMQACPSGLLSDGTGDDGSCGSGDNASGDEGQGGGRDKRKRASSKGENKRTKKKGNKGKRNNSSEVEEEGADGIPKVLDELLKEQSKMAGLIKAEVDSSGKGKMTPELKSKLASKTCEMERLCSRANVEANKIKKTVLKKVKPEPTHEKAKKQSKKVQDKPKSSSPGKAKGSKSSRRKDKST
ncbi:unnamed protein product [Effrenium voratum]|uniref:Uncharacterized protein n=1 Tax=Effrenium voratum TaxID=2562239 RepID=A0AA36N439_9DINO|nr:unnamed protein product [Effrenium voratum]